MFVLNMFFRVIPEKYNPFRLHALQREGIFYVYICCEVVPFYFKIS